ncbi:Rhodanese-like protein [Coprinopsis marcescibilis]|uniref:Rhodanese-like protein n=1 Tax=Coprinopsis marcescibilis TaxID=230819 RepID=A0A5C3L4H7_COPMA|nr:Rhodanese-like protein [Coprinopsis marcescibilis]
MKWINGDELAGIMKTEGKEAKKDFLVVDVRDDDFIGGNIVGAKNEPSNEFLTSVDALVKETKDVPLVIFHCALSQVRGPKAARIYEEAKKKLYPDEDKQEVAVLRDGFTQFQVKYKDDPKLVENYDAEVWKNEYH